MKKTNESQQIATFLQRDAASAGGYDERNALIVAAGTQPSATTAAPGVDVDGVDKGFCNQPGSRIRFEWLERNMRDGSRVGMILADLDGFKDVNTLHGYPAGDAILCQTARTLESCVRGNDFVARLGGDEFAILTQQAGSAAMESLSVRVLDAIRAMPRGVAEDVELTVSVGWALYPDDAGTIDDPSLEWRRAPLLRVVLLHVVHEVDRQSGGGAVVERGEDPRLALGGDDLHLREPGIAGELRHVFGAFRVVEVLGRDGRQRDPLAQPLHSGVVLAGDLGDHRCLIRLRDERVGSGEGHGRHTGHTGVQKIAACHVVRHCWMHPWLPGER